MQTRASNPTDRAVPGHGVRLHARDWGGSGQPVLLLHGLASNARIWDGVAPRLVGAGLRVVALDLRGHGASDQPGSGYDVASVGRDLAAQTASSPHGPWRLANSPALTIAMPIAFFRALGLASVAAQRPA